MANPRADARKTVGRKLAEAIDRLELPIQTIAKATGIDPVTLRGLKQAAPQIRTIETLSRYLQDVHRQRRFGVIKSESQAAPVG
jgi:hypothetical protein